MSTTINDLPVEIMLKIFSYLNPVVKSPKVFRRSISLASLIKDNIEMTESGIKQKDLKHVRLLSFFFDEIDTTILQAATGICKNWSEIIMEAVFEENLVVSAAIKSLHEKIYRIRKFEAELQFRKRLQAKLRRIDGVLEESDPDASAAFRSKLLPWLISQVYKEIPIQDGDDGENIH